MERQYTIYRITAPNGMAYTGYTSLPVKERWRTHKARAQSGDSPNHPFYKAISEFGSDCFTVEMLETASGIYAALALEKKWIAACPENKRLNLSPGGADDAQFGRQLFWERMNANPEEKAAYLKKLSDAKRANDWSDYEALNALSRRWRHDHPREMYYMAYRASRIARRRSGKAIDEPHVETQDERKRRLMWKYKRSEMTRRNATEQWAGISDEKRKEICEKIAASQRARMSAITDPDERRMITERARASIDREKQGPAASAGLKRFWEELRKDPARYQDYINRRRTSLKATLERKAPCKPMT